MGQIKIPSNVNTVQTSLEVLAFLWSLRLLLQTKICVASSTGVVNSTRDLTSRDCSNLVSDGLVDAATRRVLAHKSVSLARTDTRIH